MNCEFSLLPGPYAGVNSKPLASEERIALAKSQLAETGRASARREPAEDCLEDVRKSRARRAASLLLVGGVAARRGIGTA